MTVDWLVEALLTIKDALQYGVTTPDEAKLSAESLLLQYIHDDRVTSAYLDIIGYIPR